MNKLQAFCKFIDTDYSENSDDCAVSVNGNVFKYLNQEYLVLTDEEATQKAREYIRESLWAFNAEFLVNYMYKLQNNQKNMFIKYLKMIQEDTCEDCNEFIYAMVQESFDDLVEEAIQCDGRGHFLATYDGEESEEGDYFIYRIN